jgi:RNA polymerase sigma-70 factor (ECF subfamily)
MTGLDELVVAARAGGGWAFERLWLELAGQVSGYLDARGVTEVEDVTSEVFLSAFKGIPTFEGDGDAFRSWLFTIAHHRSVDEYRRVIRSDLPGDFRIADDSDTQPSGESLALEDAGIGELLSELPQSQREVIWLRFVVDLSLEEVAAITGRRLSAVKQLQRRGIDRLRRHLDGATSSHPITPTGRLPIAQVR